MKCAAEGCDNLVVGKRQRYCPKHRLDRAIKKVIHRKA